MQELRVDPEFRDKIPPLTEAEFQQLRENILADGEIYEPIAVWNGVIVDGHNRWKILQEHPELPHKIREMNFPDKWGAFQWMYKKQLGRRNLTDEQKTYMIGKMLEARKRSGNQYTVLNAAGQNVREQKSHKEIKEGTAGVIGKEVGMSEKNVRRAEKFAKGIDAIREESPEAAEKILQCKIQISKNAVSEFPNYDAREARKMVDAIKENKPVSFLRKPAPKPAAEPQTPAPKPRYDGRTADSRKDREEIAAIVADMQDISTVPEYTVEDMIDEIRSNGTEYISIVKHVFEDRKKVLTPESCLKVVNAIDDIIQGLHGLKKEVRTVAVSEGA